MNFRFVLDKLKGIKALERFLPPSLREALSEDGVASYSRYSGFLVVSACVMWVSFLVVRNHTIPDVGGLAEIITAGNSAYVANQVKRVVAANKTGVPNAPSGPAPDPTAPPQGDADVSAA